MKRLVAVAVILLVPLALVVSYLNRRRDAAAGNPHWTAVMGGTATRPNELSSAFATVVMGGMELDLRETTLGASPATLDVGVVWGGLLLRVPESWRVELDVNPTMGGVRDFREDAPQGNVTSHMRVSGSVVMGGLALVAGDEEISELMASAKLAAH